MARYPSVRRVLMTTTIIISAPIFSSLGFAQDITVLDDITVTDDSAAIGEGALDISDPSNSGETNLDPQAFDLRATSGDANSAFRTLPNVQYRSDATDDNTVAEDIGEGADDVLDLQPLEFSISGAAVNENNIMIDGVGINSILHPTGNFEPTSADGIRTPQLFTVFGLHSQSQYIPSGFVENAEVLDSNISAQYGGFLGGTVNYELRKPTLEGPSGTVSLSYSSDSLTNYRLGTEDGTNPQNRDKPEWNELSFAADYAMPVSERTALLFGLSRQRATAEKQRPVQLGSETFTSDSTSDFYRGGIVHNLLNSDVISGSVNFTDYNQRWDLENTVDTRLDIENKALLGDFGYQTEIGSLGPLRDVTLDFGVTMQRNQVSNISGDNQQFTWDALDFGGNDLSASIDGCDPDFDVGGVQKCTTGGIGDTTFDDDRLGLTAALSGSIGNGTLIAGIAYESYDVKRTGSGFEFYPLSTTIGAGTCTPGDPSCLPEQYAFFRLTQDAYDVDVTAQEIAAYAEIDQTFGDFEVRAGLRADYNDVLENVDIAPRLSATWAPNDNFAVTLGANRYFDDNYLAYAVQDAVPNSRSWSRTFGAPTDPFVETFEAADFEYTTGNLDTPYTDEYTLAVMYRDSITDGSWRLRAMQRNGHDLFAQTGDSPDFELTNDGSSEYQSIVLEYEKTAATPDSDLLDGVGLYTSVTWSDSKRSHNSYFTSDTILPRLISYKGDTFEGEEWGKVTGNLDQPLRGSVELRSAWLDGAFNLGIAADITAAYTGVIDTLETETIDGQDYDVFEDFDYKNLIRVNLNSSVQLASLNNGTDVMLNAKVTNLLNARPAGTSSDESPWVRGRSVWIGTEIKF